MKFLFVCLFVVASPKVFAQSNDSTISQSDSISYSNKIDSLVKSKRKPQTNFTGPLFGSWRGKTLTKENDTIVYNHSNLIERHNKNGKIVWRTDISKLDCKPDGLYRHENLYLKIKRYDMVLNCEHTTGYLLNSKNGRIIKLKKRYFKREYRDDIKVKIEE